MILPAVSKTVYLDIINALVRLSFNSPERWQLALLQRQLAEAQQMMAMAKTLDAWTRAG